jgi:hypothetical protein
MAYVANVPPGAYINLSAPIFAGQVSVAIGDHVQTLFAMQP